MASEKDIFGLSGPLHQNTVDWKNTHHQRSVAASLVQGVYVQERDRQLNRQGPQALGPPWWLFFHFQLRYQLVDDVDYSIFGAVYELQSPGSTYNQSTQGAPRYVIAFRGTNKGNSHARDLKLDLECVRNALHLTSRSVIAMQAVRDIVAAAGGSNVWLAGHSLGSSIAMLAGKNMARMGTFLEAFLFNPPFLSPPIERIKDKKLKHGIRFAGSIITAGLTVAVKGHRRTSRSEDAFVALSAWVPYLFVNPGDHICSEYAGYFEHRRKMEKMGVGSIERLATQNSLGGLFLTAIGRESVDSEPLHLLPSANLTTNLSPSSDFRQAHGIHQWWRPDMHFHSKTLLFRSYWHRSKKEEEMASEMDIFSLSGPLHQNIVDWKNTHQRRSVAASLVQGVYILERDRQQNRQGPEALGPPWWQFFHFQLLYQLVDDVDYSIFGAIYEFKTPASICNQSTQGAPRYVIAFRGTNPGNSFAQDLKLDLQCIRNGLHRTSRFVIAIQAVRDTVAAAGGSNVWLAGHSLGSSIAMLAGKYMAKMGMFLDAFLFSPPFISAPIESFDDEKLKHGIRIAGSFITAGLTMALKGHQQTSQSEDPFVALSAWVPCLFVNPADHICSEYAGYFEHRRKMEAMGVGSIERLATQNSLGDLFLTAIGSESVDSEPLHLLPSANLTINLSPSPNFRRAHGLHQWWGPDLHFHSKVYIYS